MIQALSLAFASGTNGKECMPDFLRLPKGCFHQLPAAWTSGLSTLMERQSVPRGATQAPEIKCSPPLHRTTRYPFARHPPPRSAEAVFLPSPCRPCSRCCPISCAPTPGIPVRAKGREYQCTFVAGPKSSRSGSFKPPGVDLQLHPPIRRTILWSPP